MGFLNDLKTSAKSEVDSAKRSMKISRLEGELADLKRIETEAYAAIGRKAYEEFGTEKYGELGDKIVSVKERIAKKEEEINDLRSLS